MARPPKVIQPEQIKQAEALAGYGLTNEQVANIIGVAINTMKKNEELMTAIKKGKDLAAANIHKTAYEIGVKEKNPAMLMFMLKCKHGWREKQEIDVNHSYKPIVITKLDGSTIELSKQKKQQQIEQSVEAEIVEDEDT